MISLRRIRSVLLVIGVGLGVLAAPAPAAAADLSQPSYLQSREVRLSDLRRFDKWTSALARYAEERAQVTARPCREPADVECRYREWLTFLDGLRDAPKWDQLVAVNSFFNARPYVEDRRNWGSTDYWATPGEFLSRSGDCEDYAIAKYLSLRELGWSDEALRVVAVKDESLGIGHAILVVFVEGRSWILDNQLPTVTETAAISHYRPVYSINETAWWLHRGGKRA